MIYLDTSALVKKYVAEEGSENIVTIMQNSVIATSRLTYPEILSAFVRRFRAGDITNNKLKEIVKDFESDWDCFTILDIHEELLPIIKNITEKHYLRGADSIHLSSALWLKNTLNEDVAFVASDTNLLNAASSENLNSINPVVYK
ncbi:MAG: type II toxin-antitoxin system VapC family toxin [Candidatus Kuenenia sp.]|nr:type II toxin-antitoxin system VapC family toxin [Candidatus Kuenenia hertensis]